MSNPGDSLDHDSKTVASNPVQSRMVRSEEPAVETIGTSDSFGTDPRDPLIGAQIQNYAIDGLLGEGGFGNVYHAVDEKLGREVALKFLRNPMNEKHRSLFEREAKAIARLGKHPHIVDIFAWGEFNNMSYFILEFVPTSLSAFIKSNPNGIPIPIAIDIVRQCAEALAFAHDEGIVHRDIKPANILLEGPEGPAKITDFGLTRLMDSTEASLLGGGISGSPPYMSPEQACGEELDNRTDIFSLGVTLYELITGRRPFEGKSPTDVINKVRGNNAVHITERNPNLPPALVQVVDKALEYNRDQRYQSAHDFARDLSMALSAPDSQMEATIPTDSPYIDQMKPKTEVPRKRTTLIGGAALAAAVLIAGWVIFFGQGSPREGVSAEAFNSLNAGNASAALPLYEKAAADTPNNADVLYGLGYAKLLQRDYAGAQAAFDQIAEADLKNEGLAALAYQQQGAEAQQTIASYASSAKTPYLLALNGMVARDQANYDAAIETLKAAESAEFSFQWQRNEALQALGQAYLKLNQLDEAEKVFASLQDSAQAETKDITAAYMAMIENERKARESAETQDMVNKLSAYVQQLKTDGTLATAGDRWKNRPLAFFCREVDTTSATAEKKGYADLLPQEVGDLLQSNHNMERVDRATINTLLQEQSLTSLSSDPAKVLGQFLNAQFYIKMKFEELDGILYPFVSLVDVATSQEYTVPLGDLEEIDAANAASFKTVGKSLADTIWATVKEHYPVQGTLSLSNAAVPQIDLGSEDGVVEGTTFDVYFKQGDAYTKSEGNTVSVKSVTGDHSATVELSGEQFTVDALKGNTFFVREAEANV